MTLPMAVDGEQQALNVANDVGDEELDDIIRTHIHSAIAVGAALTVRRERGTWRTVDGFKGTWEEFCRDRYGVSRTTAWRAIRQTKATRELPPGAQPVSRRQATRKPIDASSTDTTPAPAPEPLPPAPAPEPRYDTEGPDPEPPARHAAWAENMGWSPLDVLAALLELDPVALAADLDDDERKRTAKEVRRWAERFELASRGMVPPAQRSEFVVPIPKAGKR